MAVGYLFVWLRADSFGLPARFLGAVSKMDEVGRDKTDRMETNNDQLLLDILHLACCAVHAVKPSRNRAEQTEPGQLYRLSRANDLTNLVFEALLSAYDGNLQDTALWKKWREDRDRAVRKALLMDAERVALFSWMEQAGIWHLPLKGIVLKDFYPKVGMRQMVDNDILFDADFREQVRDWFVSRGYQIRKYGVSEHDAYQKAPVYSFEMHTALFSDDFQPDRKVWVDYYRDVKRRLLADADSCCRYHFSDEDFYLYLMAHACKHYQGGGTGLRTLLDFGVYLSAKGSSLDWDYINAELLKLRLSGFERQTRELAQKVFADPETFAAEQLSERDWKILRYYASSGTYGTVEHFVENELAKLESAESGTNKGKKMRYLWGRLFPTRTFMDHWCAYYAPFFLRHRWLRPLAPLWRLLVNSVMKRKKWTDEIRCLMKAK